MSAPPLGLIAGEGIFPHLVARGARKAGRSVVCCGFDGIADASLVDEVDRYRRVSFVRLASWARFLRKHGCREAVLVGRVKKQRLHDAGRGGELLWAIRQLPDWTTFRAWYTILRKDRRSETALLTIASELERFGVTLIDSTAYTTEHLADEGVLGRHTPDDAAVRSIERGWGIVGYLTRQDVGQCVAVRDADVLAVEAVEGTNAAIRRAGSLCRGGGWTLVKRGNTRNDMRLDVPAIGVHTIELLAEQGAECLCVEAGRVILLDKPAVLASADRLGIAVVGRRESLP
jgi:DUF1009 family protein